MPVGREDEGDIEAGRVPLALFEPASRRRVFGFRLDVSNRYGLGVGPHHDAEDVIHASATRGSAGAAIVDDHRRSGDFAGYEVLGPAARVEGWVDEFGSRIRFG